MGGEGEDRLWFRISTGRRMKCEDDSEEGCLGLMVGTIPYLRVAIYDVMMYNRV